LVLFVPAGVAQAQSAAPAKPADSGLTWNGITLYGIIDIGLQYQTHGAPVSDYFPAGTESIIQKNSNNSVTAVTPSNLSQSRIGLSGNEPIGQDWAAVFRLETFFNPQSGNISDALKSFTLNNGKALAAQSTNVDSSVAGQYFAGAAYAGFSSPSIGSFTFGRHVTTLADGIGKYDPMGASQAFSLIGFSGTTAGGGDTEDRRLDSSVKYSAKYGPWHLGALYQFSGASGSANTAWQFQLGGELAGGSLDAYYAKKNQAIAAAPLTAAQVATLATTCTTSAGAQCYSVSNSLGATISDNITYALMGLYNFGQLKLYGGYEHINFSNPGTALPNGSLTIGGYVLPLPNNTAFPSDKTLQVGWVGVKYAVTPEFELTGAYYGYKQNSYATSVANRGCSDNRSAQCSGTLSSFAFLGDYKYSKRFDGYFGTFYSKVNDGLANGYILNTSTLTTTAGIRFRF
jgi:predicted porin